MKSKNTSLADVLLLAKQLTPVEKLQLIEGIVPDLEASLEAANITQNLSKPPLRPVYGLCSDLGPAPSLKDIDDVRREISDQFAKEK